jgi:hypothetical protein
VRPENFDPAYRDILVRQEAESLQYLEGPMEQKRFGGIIRRWEDYVRLFEGGGWHPARGEASVCYLWSPTAPAHIASRIPGARIILILRDPSQRAFSQYLHNLSDTYCRHSFRAHILTSLSNKGGGLGLYHPFLEFGFYSVQIQRYLDHFPRHQLGIWLYEDTLNPRRFLTEVLHFLGVDAGFLPDSSTRHLQAKVPRLRALTQSLRRNGAFTALKRVTPAPLESALHTIAYRKASSVKIPGRDRAFLVDYYRADIGRLSALIHRDLSAWLL